MRSRTVYLRSFGRQTCAQRNKRTCVWDALENATTREKNDCLTLAKGERAHSSPTKLNSAWFGFIEALIFISFSFRFFFEYCSLLFSSISLSLSRFTLTLFKFTLEMNSETITLPFINGFSPYIHTYIHKGPVPRACDGQGTTTNNNNNHIEIETECMCASGRETNRTGINWVNFEERKRWSIWRD